jgi:hypothetical protein
VDPSSVVASWLPTGSQGIERPFKELKSLSFQEAGFKSRSSIYFAFAECNSESLETDGIWVADSTDEDSASDQGQQPSDSPPPTRRFPSPSISFKQLEGFFEDGTRGSYLAALTFSSDPIFEMLGMVFEKRLRESPPRPRRLRITLENMKLCLLFGSEDFVERVRDHKSLLAGVTSGKTSSFLGVSINSPSQAEGRLVQSLVMDIGVLS